MKKTIKNLHIVQISYDSSVFEQLSSSDTLGRQLAYGRILSANYPSSFMSFVVLTSNSGLQPFQKENVHFLPLYIRTRDEIFSVVYNFLTVLHSAFPIHSISTQTVHEDGMAALQFKRDQLCLGQVIPVTGQIHYDIFSPVAQDENIGTGPAGTELLNRISGTLRDYDALRVVGTSIKNNLLTRQIHGSVHVIPVPVTMLSTSTKNHREYNREHMVLFVGRLEIQKRLDNWLRVASYVCERDQAVRFEVVGDGSLRSNLERLSSELNLNGRVFFRGELPYSQLPDIYSQAKVFLLTSSYEGFGRVLAEAYAYGVPAVASRITGVEDIVIDGVTGYLNESDDVVSMGENVLRLINNDTLRKQMGKAGEEYVLETFSPDVLAVKWVELLTTLAEEALTSKPSGILAPRKASYSRYKKLCTMDYSLLRAMQYEAIQGLTLRGRTLDIGGGQKNSYYHLLNIEGSIESVNMDANIQPTYLSDLNQALPFPAETYDNVISLNTFEHILNDQLVVSESLRVLKHGGQFHFMVLFLYKEHGSPYDYHRHTGRWWFEFLTSLGIDQDDVTIEPLVWDAETSAASIVHWQGDAYFRKWLMLKAVKEQWHIKAARLPSTDLAEFALGYYISGKKSLYHRNPEQGGQLAGVPRTRYIMDADYKSKYATVAAWFQNINSSGTLLDIGSRDRILKTYLNNDRIQYYSADTGAGHDFAVDLEHPLPFENGKFNHVVALDVLEHVENIHSAFLELARITQNTLIIALPNIAVYSKRLSFMNTGHLGTGKYDLLEEHQGDRHRWLTTYPQMNRFIGTMALKAGFAVVRIFEEIEGGQRELALSENGEAKDGVYCDRCIYVMQRFAN